jgi:UDP-N-acetylmuramate--alanine ligase
VIVTEVYPAGEKPIEGATGKALADAIRAHGHRAVRYVADKNEVAAALHHEVEPGDLVIALGAGDINASARKLVGLIEGGR